MANLLQDKQDSDLNPGDADYRRKTTPSEELKELNRSEAAGNLEKEYGKELDSDPGIKDAQEQARLADANPTQPTWDSSRYTGGNNQEKQKFNFRRKGPIGALIAVLFGGAFGIAGVFGGPSLLLVQIEETFTGDPRINTQLTSLSLREDQMISSKFQGSTQGVCGASVSILCKFTRPSNYLLKQMDANGITAYKGGEPMELSNSPFPNGRPDYLQFAKTDGTILKIEPGDLLTTLRSEPEFAAAFNKAYNPRFISLADDVFSAIKTRLGFTGSDPDKDATSEKDVDNKLTDEALGESTDGSTSGADTSGSSEEEPSGTAAATEIEDDIAKDIESSLKNVGEDSTKGASFVSLAAGVACAAGDVPGMAVKVVRDYQLGQFVRYAAVFLIVAGALKAGDANQTEIAALGTLLTVVVAGKTAMDSYGMRSTLLGDSGIGGDSLISTFTPGGRIAKEGWGIAANVLSGPVKTSVCSVATSPATQAAIDVGADSTGIGGIVNTILGVGGGFALSELSGPISSLVAKAIPASFIEDMVGDIAGDALSGLSGGEGVGDALASGAENMMAETANAGGNMPLSVTQAVAYNNETQSVAYQYAQTDRATYSPLDASNPNTALGSFVNQFMPYYADLSSASGVMSMIGSVVGSSFGTIFNPATASADADPQAQYNQCPDQSIQASNTAASAFCAIDYGIPTEYLNISPTQVVSDLTQTGDIDSEGNVVTTPSASTSVTSAVSSVFGTSTSQTATNLNDWINMCTDGSTSAIAGSTNNCTITNKQSAEYALYTVDHRVQETMDGEETVLQTGSPDSSGSSSSTSTGSTTDSASTTSAYTTTTSSLVALLSSLNQPIIGLPSSYAVSLKPVKPSAIIATTVNKFIAVATPAKRYAGITI